MDSVCKLIKEQETGRDKYGNPTVERIEREVFCQILSVTRSEFYAAATADITPQFIVRLQEALEYQGEKIVEYEGELYSVIRAYRDRGSMGHTQIGAASPMDSNAIELTVGKKVGNV